MFRTDTDMDRIRILKSAIRASLVCNKPSWWWRLATDVSPFLPVCIWDLRLILGKSIELFPMMIVLENKT